MWYASNVWISVRGAQCVYLFIISIDRHWYLIVSREVWFNSIIQLSLTILLVHHSRLVINYERVEDFFCVKIWVFVFLFCVSDHQLVSQSPPLTLSLSNDLRSTIFVFILVCFFSALADCYCSLDCVVPIILRFTLSVYCSIESKKEITNFASIIIGSLCWNNSLKGRSTWLRVDHTARAHALALTHRSYRTHTCPFTNHLWEKRKRKQTES